MSAAARRIWSEEVPCDVLGRRELLRPLAERGCELIVAVRPWTTRDARVVVEACREAGVRVGLWPMLADDEGRWASAANLPAFGGFARRLAEELSSRGALPDELVIDLEPPIGAVRRLVERLRPGRTLAARRLDVGEALHELVRELASTGASVSAAAVPLVLADDEGDEGHGGWQRWLGTPVDGVGFSRIEVMLYTSLLEGYSRGALDRAAARHLLCELSRLARGRFGDRAAVALGAVWTGALGHEPVYRSVHELADDVAVARHAGIEALSLFDLGGALRRPPLETWLDAFVDTPAAPRAPRPSVRGRSVWWLLRRVGAWGPRPR